MIFFLFYNESLCSNYSHLFPIIGTLLGTILGTIGTYLLSKPKEAKVRIATRDVMLQDTKIEYIKQNILDVIKNEFNKGIDHCEEIPILKKHNNDFRKLTLIEISGIIKIFLHNSGDYSATIKDIESIPLKNTIFKKKIVQHYTLSFNVQQLPILIPPRQSQEIIIKITMTSKIKNIEGIYLIKEITNYLKSGIRFSETLQNNLINIRSRISIVSQKGYNNDLILLKVSNDILKEINLEYTKKIILELEKFDIFFKQLIEKHYLENKGNF